MLKKMIEKEVKRQVERIVEDFNAQVDTMTRRHKDWQAHAERVEEHGEQIERFLGSFETIAAEMLARTPKPEPVKETE